MASELRGNITKVDAAQYFSATVMLIACGFFRLFFLVSFFSFCLFSFFFFPCSSYGGVPLGKPLSNGAPDCGWLNLQKETEKSGKDQHMPGYESDSEKLGPNSLEASGYAVAKAVLTTIKMLDRCDALPTRGSGQRVGGDSAPWLQSRKVAFDPVV